MLKWEDLPVEMQSSEVALPGLVFGSSLADFNLPSLSHLEHLDQVG